MGLTLRKTPAVRAEADGTTAIIARWSPVADADSYRVYRDGDLVASPETDDYPAEQSWQDTGLDPDTEYNYRVAAVINGHEGTQSKVRPAASATTQAVPDQVTGLEVTEETSSTVSLSWTAVSGA